MTSLTTTDRLLALLDALGVERAHVAAPMPGDMAGLAAAHPGRIGGLVLCTPTRLDPAPLTDLAERMLVISGGIGLGRETAERALPRLPGAEHLVLPGYEATAWADVMHDRLAPIADAMTAFLARHAADTPRSAEARGDVAGLSFEVRGSGPALLLLPFFLAPSQWRPALDRLAERFTVIAVGGPHLGGVAVLEDRARAPTYAALFRTLVDVMDPRPGEAVLDVGCGSGALDRMLACRLGVASAITAIDSNPFLLSEAAALAAAEGLDRRIHFEAGSAERLPFADGTFGCAFSVTVLEECDADRALAEMARVVRPGGRVGVVVRSIDLPQWWHVTVPDALRTRVETPPQSVAPAGVADASLYRRMRKAGFVDLVCFPMLVTLDRPEGPIWRYREDHVRSQLAPEETSAWQAARDEAAADGLLFMAHPMHCAVGTKPDR